MNPLQKNAPFFLSLFFCALVFLTLGDYGMTWDEGVYYRAGKFYGHWLRSPSWETIDSFWAVNREHPPLTKALGGLTEFLFAERWNLLDRRTSFRLPSLLFVFLANYFLFLLALEWVDFKTALLTTASFSFLPRVFFHSHLGGMDYAVTALWVAAVYSYGRGVKKPRWAWAAAALLGLALLTKINGFLLGISLLFYWGLKHSGHFLSIHGSGAMKWRFSEKGRTLLPLFILPPVLFLALWPWLWKEPWTRILEYLSFHGRHSVVTVLYLGEQTASAAWHYPFVLAGVTIPLIILIPSIGGALAVLLRPGKERIWILFNAFFGLAMLALPGVPKYDGVRLFLPAFPFICLLAGMGIHHFARWVSKWGVERGFFLLYSFLFLGTLYFSVLRIHPYQSSYYNEIAGGTDGAVKKGFEGDYWGNAYLGLLPWMNEQEGKTFWLYMADIEPRVLWGFDLYRKDGLLKENLRFAGPLESDFLILLTRQGFFSPEAWRFYREEKPVFSVRFSRTPLVNVYDLKKGKERGN